MYSYTSFTPGANFRCRRLLAAAIVNNIINNINNDNINNGDFTNITLKTCNYAPTVYQKLYKPSIKPEISNARRVSQVLQRTVGGSTQFGNYYLGKPTVFNYLGRVEGQPGGSGAPLRNKF
jgi:hypothetical protein